MKWKTKPKEVNTNWHKVFVWYVKTEDGYTVVCETIWRKYKIHMSSGEYIYRVNGPHNDPIIL